MIYYFAITCLLIFSFLNQWKLERKVINLLAFFSFLIILIIGGLRFKIGADWDQYESIYKNLKDVSELFKAPKEMGFMITMFLIKLISTNYSFFIFIFFLVSFYLKYKVIKKYSTDIFLSLSFYFFSIFLILDVNQIRQGMALAIIFLSLTSILERNVIKFLLLIFIACFFHISAIIFLPFYWLSQIKSSNMTIFLIIAISLILSILIRELMGRNTIVRFLLSFSGLSRYNVYLESNILSKSSSILSIAFFQRIIIFIIFIVYYNIIQANDNFKSLIKNGYLIGIIIFIIFSFNAQFAARLGYFYKWFDIFIVALIVSSQKKNSNKLILLFLFFLFCLIGIQRLIGNDGGDLLPYHIVLR
jgi:hypothetical protein